MRVPHRPAIDVGNYALLPLGASAKDGYAKISKKDMYLDRFSWCKSNSYAYARVNGKVQSLHRILLELKDRAQEADHINRDKLDCRRENLRVVTSSQNKMNRSGKKSTSKYKGVSYDKANNKWSVYIQANGKFIWVGRFLNEINAALAYNTVAIKHHGEYAILNKVERLS